MGMFDRVYIDERVISAKSICCLECGESAADLEFQTKAFECVMEDYFLTYNKEENIVLKKLDSPHDKRFWHEYTEEEVAESIKDAEEKDGLWKMWIKKKGDGYFTEEAFLPENRVQRSMGELPHCWVSVYTHCDKCRKKDKDKYVFIDLNIKFTDGVVEKIEKVDQNNESK